MFGVKPDRSQAKASSGADKLLFCKGLKSFINLELEVVVELPDGLALEMDIGGGSHTNSGRVRSASGSWDCSTVLEIASQMNSGRVRSASGFLVRGMSELIDDSL